MLELVAIWCFGKSMYETARQKGRSGWFWALLFIVVWFGAEIFGAAAFAVGWQLFFGSAPAKFLIYIAAAGTAFVAGLLLGKILDGRPSLVPPPLPIRRPSRAPMSATPRSVRLKSAQPVCRAPAQFKFSCPHCGQHISTTTDQVATEASCPTCNNVLKVPAPGVPVSAPLGRVHVTAAVPIPIPCGQFKFSCPHCGQRISATADQAETEATCPACDNVLSVPAPSA